MKRFVLVLAFVAATAALPTRKIEGEACGIDGSQGVCRLISECPRALSDLRMRIKPKRCGFSGKTEIVCCPSEVNKVTVSQKKCSEYRAIYRTIPRLLIQNGIQPDDTDLPHMAAVGYFDGGRPELSWRCAGTLISDQFVMTAAHCCKSMDKPARVLLGIIDTSAKIPEGNLYEVDQIIPHPEYDAPYHDIGLLKLSRKVIFSEYVAPACLHSSLEDPKKALIVAGWGTTSQFGMSKVLLMTYLQAAPLADCEVLYKSKFSKGIDNSVICAGDPRAISNTCRGDSGGPLFLKDDSDISVVGITSLGRNPCGSAVAVYVRVSKYIDWIEKVVWS